MFLSVAQPGESEEWNNRNILYVFVYIARLLPSMRDD